AGAKAIDLSGLETIGPVSSHTANSTGVIFNCSDGSQVQVSVLAPDLVRVRASYRKRLPQRDHSWAIAKTDWVNPEWKLTEAADAFVITTSELQVVVRRSPLLVEFRDAKTGKTINADARPMMFDSKGSTIAAAKKLGFEEHFYGLGEKASRLDKRRLHFTNWNSDTPAYKEGTDPIYQSIPFYIGWQNGDAYGLFFDNSYRTHFDFGQSTQEYAAFSADGGEMNYYFFLGPSIKKILGRYGELTGHMPLPPMWALGNQQSRWSYYPDTVAEEVVRQYRQHDLPLDVLYLDIHYMQGYRVFTWDTTRYANPKSFTERLKQQGVKVVPIVDPGVKYQPPPSGASSSVAANPELAPQDKSYYVYNQGREKDYFLKRKDGSLYIGKVWPGESVYVDFTLEAARRWWGDLHRAYTDNGIAGIWNDMNEPSDFVDQTGKMQMDVVNYDEGEYSTHAKNRNTFALLMARATREGLERLQPDKRPYIITRAGYAGYQRYTTTWTGDNTSTWEAMALSLPMFQSLGLSGVAFVGTDVGGFIGRCDGEMLTRWYQVGFLTPMCRNHMQIDSYDHEPWRFGKYYEDIIRKYLKLRYRLLPFLYTTLEEAARTGVPVFRPLLLNYQQDANTLDLDDEFMIGSELLVAPILKRDMTSRMVYLPQGTWIDYWTGKRITGGSMIRVEAPLETVPMFVRAGSIIPMGPEMNYVGEKPADPMTFVIYPDESGQAATALYEDDGVSPAYRQGIFRRTPVSVSRSGNGFQIEVGAREGSYNPKPRNLIFVVKSMSAPRQVLVDGKPLAAAGANESKSGWYRVDDGVAVRIADDGKAHRIQVR
ncbi:MAG TPA: glycoside hydrolase family 31 protein, partial [Blastocatellia bacterium]|nr:glycoside hydrolase family 31 protein [Blastocatellia bacterium]